MPMMNMNEYDDEYDHEYDDEYDGDDDETDIQKCEEMIYL